MKISPLRPLLCAFLCVGAFLPPVGADSSDGDTRSSWTIQRETDPIFDVPNVTAHLRETGAKSSLPGIEKALVMRCVEQKLELIRIRGHLTLWGGGIHHGEIKTAVRAGVPSPDG